MGEILGVKPIYVLAAAVIVGLGLVIFSALFAGPGVILDGAFGIITQSVSSAGATLDTFVAQAANIVDQGMSVVSNAITQLGQIAAQAIATMASVVDNIFEIAATAIAAIGQMITSIISTAGQIIAGAASLVVNTIFQVGAALVGMFFTVEAATVQFTGTLIGNAIIGLGEFFSVVTLGIANIIASAFNGVAAIFGNLLSIPMILLFGYISVATTVAGLVPQLFGSVVSVFSAIFNRILRFFTVDLINIIKELPNKIVEGFTVIVNSLGGILKGVFFG
jgi:phage-related protein